MKKALIIVDYINDFVDSNGKLTCGEPGQKIDGKISKIVADFSESGDFIVIASDNHAEDDIYSPEHGLFPAHCIGGTAGSELYGKTSEAVKNADPKSLIKIEKSRYSAFAATGLDLRLRERGVHDVYLVGVCSDICVLHTAIDAYNLGYNIFVYENGIASFNNDGHNFALAHFKNTLGATILI